MKRIALTLICALAVMFAAGAQDSDAALAPGIYAAVDGEMTHLEYSNGTAVASSSNLLGIEVGNSKFKYKGEASGVQVKDKIVLVIDPQKKNIVKTPKKYDPFVKTMTPASIIIVPLVVEKGKRVYYGGRTIEGFNTTRKERVEFEWELVDDNTFEITADLEPGEYAVVFKPAKLGEFDFTSIYGFCVAE